MPLTNVVLLGGHRGWRRAEQQSQAPRPSLCGFYLTGWVAGEFRAKGVKKFSGDNSVCVQWSL